MGQGGIGGSGGFGEALGSRLNLLTRTFAQTALRWRRAPAASPRIRRRRRGTLPRLVVQTLVEEAVLCLAAGGLCSHGASPSRALRVRAAQAARDMCREEPLAFEGDKRGHLETLVKEIMFGESHAADRDVPFYKVSEYLLPGIGAGGGSAMKVYSDRIGLPRRACVVRLADWLPSSVGAAFDAPPPKPAALKDQLPGSQTDRSFFAVEMNEWYKVVRRMARAGLGRMVPQAPGRLRRAAGAFAVPKDAQRDRLIGDRRPENCREDQVGHVRLPYAPRLRRLVLPPESGLRVHLRDVRDCYYMYAVEPHRLPRQLVGPRIPRSWLADLDDVSLDSIPPRETWLYADLTDPSGVRLPESVVPGYCEFAIAGVIMGDTNAVFAVETAHRRQLFAAGAMRPEGMLIPGLPFPKGDVINDVFIDDLAYLVLADLLPSGRVEQRRVEEVVRADIMYTELGMEVSSAKAIDDDKGELWGAQIDGCRGIVGFGAGRRATLMFATAMGLLYGVNREQLQQLLGTWNFAMAFRPLSLSSLGVVYQAVEGVTKLRRVHLTGAARDDLLLALGIGPLLTCDLRARPSLSLFATDASPFAAGACSAPISRELWDQLYDLTEERGEHVRLDWGDSPPPVAISDYRSSAAGAIMNCDWEVCLSRPFTGSRHINLLELDALIMLVKRLKRQGESDIRIIVAVDSRVVVGAVAKGRSSSRKLNFRLRQLAALSLEMGIYVDLLWVPTWANPADAPSRFVGLLTWRSKLPILPTKLPVLKGAEAALVHQAEITAELVGPAADLRRRVDSRVAGLDKETTVQADQDSRQSLAPVYAPLPTHDNGRWDEAWREILLLIAGDVEPHPGPGRRRAQNSAQLGEADLLQEDV